VRSFTSKRVRVLVGLLALMLVVAFLLPVAGCKKDTTKDKILRVAFSAAPDAIDVVGYKMIEILKARGINAEAIYCDGGPKAIQALLAGQADVACNSLEDIVNANMVAFALQRPKNMYSMVGRKDMTTVEQIKGGKIGAADPGSIANTIAERIFENHGLKKEDVTWMQIGGNKARAAALLAGNADAVFVYGGNYLILRAEGYPTLTTMQAEFPGLHDDMWCSERAWLDENGDVAQAICEAQIEAAKWFHEDKAGWLALCKERVEGLDEAVALQLYDVMTEMDMYPLDGLMTLETCATTSAFLITAGVIPDIPVSQWADLQYMEKAREKLGITVN